MPPFVREDYTVTVVPTPLSTWIQSGLRVWLAACRDGGEVFPAHDLAEGFRLWVQMAVIEASIALKGLAEWIATAFGAAERTRGGFAGPDAWLGDVAPAVEAFVDIGVLRREADGAPNDGDVRAAVERVADSCSPLVGPQGLDGLVSEATRLFILDEPEQHLHPRLQRAAAAWLAEHVQGTAAAAVVATHSVAFMQLDPSTHYLHVLRDGRDGSRVAPLDPRALGAADLAAADLGLDRGELITLVNRIVFLEGQTDRAFIDALYGPELRQAGVVLLPPRGRHAHSICSADERAIDALYRCSDSGDP